MDVSEVFYDPVTKIISTPKDETVYCPEGVGWYLHECMTKYSDNIAQIDAVTGKKDSYGSLLERCIRTSIELRNRGIKPGDIISICSGNHLDAVVPLIASFFVGAYVANLDPKLILNDVKHMIHLAKPKIIFASQAGVELLEKSMDETSESHLKIVLFGKSDKYEEFNTFLQPKFGENDFEPFACKHLKETCILMFSSGTTGLPKPIALNHGYILSMCKNFKVNVGLIYSTFYWISAVSVSLGAAMNGTMRIICLHFDSNLVWDYLEKYEVEGLMLVPADAISIILTKPINTVCKLKIMCSFGEKISANNLKKLQEEMPNTLVVSGYGQTEVGTTINSSTLKMIGNYDSVGIPVKGITYKIVDPDTEEALGLNEKGELRVKKEYYMNGYYNMDSSAAWDQDGFIKTGDIAYFDDNFYLYVVDRIKEIFKCKVFHITPLKLEAVLDAHPDVIRSTVIGIPHEIDMNQPMGVVVLKKGSKLTVEELLEYFNEQVDEREHLTAGLKFVDELPLTPTGKVKRIQLKQMALNGLL